MHRKLTIPVVLTIALFLTLALPTSAWAADVFKVKGENAYSTFSRFEASGGDKICIRTDVGVFASDDATHTPADSKTSSSVVAVYILKYNVCTDTHLLAAYGFAYLAGPDFQVKNSLLDSATLNAATVHVVDALTGTSFDVSINLAWSATDPATSYHGISHSKSPGCTMSGKGSGSSRLASATGTVSDGTTNFISSPTEDALLNWSKSSTVTIGCSA